VLARLEAALLADLAAAGQTTGDLLTALGACQPGATAIVGPMAALVGLSAELASLGQAGLRPEVIPSPNTTALLVISMPAVTIAASSVRIGQQVEPGLVGVGIAAYAYGIAGTAMASAVQVVTTP
jgi:hypothetical protein